MNPFKRFFHLASRFAVRLFPIRPNAFDGAFAGLLVSLGGVADDTLGCILEFFGGVAGNTRVCVHVSLGDVVDDMLDRIHVSLGDVVDDMLADILEFFGGVAGNTRVCILVPWMFSIHIPTSPFPLLRAGNHPD